jgi:hypothetical protein
MNIVRFTVLTVLNVLVFIACNVRTLHIVPLLSVKHSSRLANSLLTAEKTTFSPHGRATSFLLLSKDVQSTNLPDLSVRLNKCLSNIMSRRSADAALAAGRVSVNGRIATVGEKVIPGDVIRLDDCEVIGWEGLLQARLTSPVNQIEQHTSADPSNDTPFIYIKYWKPMGVTCTTDEKDRTNILRAGRFQDHFPNCRLFPVGRLDKDSTGLILLTSDGRVNNALLRKQYCKEKVSSRNHLSLCSWNEVCLPLFNQDI